MTNPEEIVQRLKNRKEPKAKKMKLWVTPIRLNSQGYDSHGRYYGTGAPLYNITDDSGLLDVTTRSSGAAGAKIKVLERLTAFLALPSNLGEDREDLLIRFSRQFSY